MPRSNKPGTVSYSRRVVFGIVLLLAMALLSGLELLQEITTIDLNSLGNDPISVYQQRFEALRPMLPEHEVLGYFTSRTPAQVEVDGQALAAYYLTQYALAPAIVVNERGREYLVGNFPSPFIDQALLQSQRLTVTDNLENGVFLLRREEK